MIVERPNLPPIMGGVNSWDSMTGGFRRLRPPATVCQASWLIVQASADLWFD